MIRSTDEFLSEALVHFEILLDHAQRGTTDQLVIDAVCLRLSAGLEVLNRMEPGVRDQLFGDSWPLMWGMRNRIAHGYLLVDPVIIGRTIDTDIPTIMNTIRRALDR